MMDFDSIFNRFSKKPTFSRAPVSKPYEHRREYEGKVQKYNTNDFLQRRNLSVLDGNIIVTHGEKVKKEISIASLAGISKTSPNEEEFAIHFHQTHALDMPEQ